MITGGVISYRISDPKAFTLRKDKRKNIFINILKDSRSNTVL